MPLIINILTVICFIIATDAIFLLDDGFVGGDAGIVVIFKPLQRPGDIFVAGSIEERIRSNMKKGSIISYVLLI